MKRLVFAGLMGLLICPSALSEDSVAVLEKMHRRAEQQLLVSDFETALKIYEEIILREPDDDTAYAAMGQIYLIRGQFKKAHDAFQSALEIDPDNETAVAGITAVLDPDGVKGLVRVD